MMSHVILVSEITQLNLCANRSYTLGPDFKLVIAKSLYDNDTFFGLNHSLKLN